MYTQTSLAWMLLDAAHAEEKATRHLNEGTLGKSAGGQPWSSLSRAAAITSVW